MSQDSIRSSNPAAASTAPTAATASSAPRCVTRGAASVQRQRAGPEVGEDRAGEADGDEQVGDVWSSPARAGRPPGPRSPVAACSTAPARANASTGDGEAGERAPHHLARSGQVVGEVGRAQRERRAVADHQGHGGQEADRVGGRVATGERGVVVGEGQVRGRRRRAPRSRSRRPAPTTTAPTRPRATMPSMAIVEQDHPGDVGHPGQARERHPRHAGVDPEPAEHHREHHHRGGQAAALPPQGPGRERRQGRPRALAQHPLHHRQDGQEGDPHHDRGHQLAAPQPLGHAAARHEGGRAGPDAHPRTQSPQPSVRPHRTRVRSGRATRRARGPGDPAPGAAHDRARGPPRRARLVRAAGEHRARRHRQRGRRGHRHHPGGRRRRGSPPRGEGAHRRCRGARRPPRDDRRDRGAGAAEPLPAELGRRHHRGRRRGAARSRT